MNMILVAAIFASLLIRGFQSTAELFKLTEGTNKHLAVAGHVLTIFAAGAATSLFIMILRLSR